MTTLVYLVAAVTLLVAGLSLYRLLRPRPSPPAGNLTATKLRATGHRVFTGPLEHNEHGFITTPLTHCVDHDCHCRKGLGGPTP